DTRVEPAGTASDERAVRVHVGRAADRAPDRGAGVRRVDRAARGAGTRADHRDTARSAAALSGHVEGAAGTSSPSRYMVSVLWPWSSHDVHAPTFLPSSKSPSICF